MADEQLRQFYDKCAKAWLLGYEFYACVKAKDRAKGQVALRSLLEETKQWQAAKKAERDHEPVHNDFLVEHYAWFFKGGIGEPPKEPPIPDEIPKEENASRVLERIIQLIHECNGNRWGDSDWADLIACDLRYLATVLFIIYEELRPSKPDELIDRNQLAKLTGISVKTLKNNPQWLPDPVKRGKKDVPIYRYSEARARLAIKRPDVAKLPPYSEALAIIGKSV